MTKKEAAKLVPRGQIEWLMGRIHVYSRPRYIIRELRKHMGSYKARVFRNYRHACYRYAFKQQEKDSRLMRHFRL